MGLPPAPVAVAVQTGERVLGDPEQLVFPVASKPSIPLPPCPTSSAPPSRRSG